MRSRAYVLTAVLACAAPAVAQDAVPTKSKDTEGLFLDMSKVNLGSIGEEDKKKTIYTIQLEKARLTRKTLRIVYENAFDLYKDGQYEAANDLTRKILAIDPGYEDASILNRATMDLKGTIPSRVSERRMLEDRFDVGMTLYRQGRLSEAAEKWDEVVKLSPANLKARYWLRKARGELADDHYRRGEKAYRQHRLREALDQWYAALVLNPKYPRLTANIAKVESEEREQESAEKLQTALNLYGQGLVTEALKMLDQVLETGPGNQKALKLQTEIRAEVGNQRVAEGRRLYEQKQYEKAIAEWKAAATYGYDAKAIDQLTARAKEQQKREEAEKKRAAERAKERQEVAKKKQEEDAKAAAERKKEEDAAAAGGQPASATAAAAAEDAKKQSAQAYLEGVIYYQKGDYQTARDKWMRAKQLDPSNADAAQGLEKIDKLYGGGN